MENFTVEKGIPIPPPSKCGPKTSAFILAMKAMQIGDSILAELKSKNQYGGIVTYHAKTSGNKFTTRRFEKDGKRWIRIWRTQ